ncbi:aldo/keto reductase [Falsigemmobacter faecalis]|uniref:Aldo/keto reductase n=1 Tax=Falsigemmobacter faecalis TaxID=2488730 RepID=A0A3P3DWA1_9RHOB|nr:aldo/keto reductase [Falsigemmobacter faecalis]RRH78274.1 aldo/keto reductase [Falsigemmobacter faecalis]
MDHRALGRSGLSIAPFILGTNTAGWTADQATSFDIFDAFTDQGFGAFDTADVYSRWVPGNDSESERILGRWMKARGNRDRVQIFTKVGMDLGAGGKGLSAAHIERAAEASLRRLQTDYIDLYQSHLFDAGVPQDETLKAYERLIAAGKVRAIGCSNFNADQLGEALSLSQDQGLPRYETVQNEYNLRTRHKYEGDLQDLMLFEGLSLIPFYSLSAGFLTGKYRTKADLAQSPRGNSVSRYLNDDGLRVLAAMDQVTEARGASHAALAISWLLHQPGVVAPLASVTSVAQLTALLEGVLLQLTPEDLNLLDLKGL